MDGCNRSIKKVTLDDKMDASNWPFREASTVKKIRITGRKITHYFKKMDDCKWCFEKKSIVFYKILMLQIDPLNSNCS